MAIRLVVFDADKTLWSYANVSSLILPFKLIDKNTISDSNGETFHIFEGVYELLTELQKRNVTITMASWNKPEPVREALRLFGIDKFFKIVKAEFHPDKHIMIEGILSKLSKEGIELRPEEILYVDDRNIHLQLIKEKFGQIRFVQMWVDVKAPIDILEYIEKT
jgi:magnesium-dependent phosphatase-1